MKNKIADRIVKAAMKNIEKSDENIIRMAKNILKKEGIYKKEDQTKIMDEVNLLMEKELKILKESC